MKNLLNRLNRFPFFIKLFSLSLLLGFLFACQPSQTENTNTKDISESAKITPTPEEEISEFEKELKSMRVADFHYIFTLKRKDGEKFTGEDRTFVRDRKHYAANRFTFVDDDKVLFVGSNYVFTNKNMQELKDRFELADFSKPKEQIEREKEELRKKREEADENSNSNTETEKEKS